ncbi:MAG: Gfo/Idh/MocA family oxidoreductase [Phycisphaerae bacterium]|nr:Gfo/Idh/MocA family oxidoreductase [Phycisphaerae bacterium]
MTIRVGIIGCGAISASHIEALRGLPSAELIACADMDPTAARQRADEFGVRRVYTISDDLLSRGDVDMVSICVPPKWHAEVFAKAVDAGKHILIEKPLAVDLAQADRMLDMARGYPGIIGVALVHRYLPAYQVLGDLIQGGAIGTIRHVRLSYGHDMYGDSRFAAPNRDPRAWLVDHGVAGGGILMSSSIHFLSAVSFVLGNPVASHVTARARRLHPKAFPGIEDEVELRIELESGPDFVLRESWVSDAPYRAEFSGQRGRLVVEGDNWRNLSIHGTCQGPVPPAYRHCLDGAGLRADSPHPAAPVRPLFEGLMADLLESIKRGAIVTRLPDAVHARNMQAVIAAAYRSEETAHGQAVDWRSEL